MRPDTELPPLWRMWEEMIGTWGNSSETAMVSPRARPRPSIEPPIHAQTIHRATGLPGLKTRTEGNGDQKAAEDLVRDLLVLIEARRITPVAGPRAVRYAVNDPDDAQTIQYSPRAWG